MVALVLENGVLPSNSCAVPSRHRAAADDHNALALECAPVAFAVSSLAGNLLYANDQFLELCALDDDAIDVHVDIRRASGQYISSALLDGVIREGRPRQSLIAWPTAAGESRELLCSVSRVSSKGTPVCLSWVLQDLSALAAEHRRQLSDLFEAQRLLHAASWRMRLDQGQELQTNPMSWSPAIEELLGTGAQAVPATLHDYLRFVAVEDRQRLSTAMADAVVNRDVYEVEYELKGMKGQPRRMRGYGTVITDAATSQSKLLGIEIDVTEQQPLRHEPHPLGAMFDALLEGTDSPIYIVDRKLRYARFNSAYAALIVAGGGPRVQIGGSILDAMTDPVRRRHLGGVLGRVLKGERLIDGADFPSEQVVEQQWFDFSFSPVRGAQGQIEGAIAFGRDISALKRADYRHQHLNEELGRRVEVRTAELSAANQDLNAFVSSVSHDLQSPLRSLEGQLAAAETHSEGDDPARLADHFRKARASIARMRTLVDDLLELSRVGRQAMQVETIDMNRLVQDILQDLAAQLEGRDIELDIARLPALRADPTLARQVLQNLLSNAIKFTRDRKPGRISVRASASDAELVWSVGDNGVGFSMEHADEIFAPFVQIHTAFSKLGSGIGLTIVKRALGQMGGRIWAQSSPGQGATFNFTFGTRTDGAR